MAEVEKFNDSGVMMLLKHSDRQLKNDSNKDINQEKSDLNYSIGLKRQELTPKQLYKKMKDESYLYGRGSQRESSAITCCSWVITLPKSISDYSVVAKDEITVLNPDTEKAFFAGVYQFISERYGTCFYNRIHYDEGGQPHIHVYFVPQTKIDHDVVHFKTVKTHQTVRLESGRYEYAYQFKLENGEKISLKNYAKQSDLYDVKISGADVLNKAELQHFHEDLAAYLKKNHLPGADSVHTGSTEGKNISVQSLKSFTKATGLTINELKEHPLSQDELDHLLSEAKLAPSVRSTIETINSASAIEKLEEQIQELSKTADRARELEQRLSDLEKAFDNKQRELEQAHARIKELEHPKTVDAAKTDLTQEWGTHSSSWDVKAEAGWGTHTITNDKTW